MLALATYMHVLGNVAATIGVILGALLGIAFILSILDQY